MSKSYKNIKKILKIQIDNNINHKWAWRSGDNAELYTAQQLLNKLNESDN